MAAFNIATHSHMAMEGFNSDGTGGPHAEGFNSDGGLQFRCGVGDGGLGEPSPTNATQGSELGDFIKIPEALVHLQTAHEDEDEWWLRYDNAEQALMLYELIPHVPANPKTYFVCDVVRQGQ